MILLYPQFIYILDILIHINSVLVQQIYGLVQKPSPIKNTLVLWLYINVNKNLKVSFFFFFFFFFYKKYK